MFSIDDACDVRRRWDNWRAFTLVDEEVAIGGKNISDIAESHTEIDADSGWSWISLLAGEKIAKSPEVMRLSNMSGSSIAGGSDANGVIGAVAVVKGAEFVGSV